MSRYNRYLLIGCILPAIVVGAIYASPYDYLGVIGEATVILGVFCVVLFLFTLGKTQNTLMAFVVQPLILPMTLLWSVETFIPARWIPIWRPDYTPGAIERLFYAIVIAQIIAVLWSKRRSPASV